MFRLMKSTTKFDPLKEFDNMSKTDMALAVLGGLVIAGIVYFAVMWAFWRIYVNWLAN